jgi:hypothetical protein
MSLTTRWSVYCAVVVALVSASAQAGHTQSRMVLRVHSPQQLVEIPDARGRTRLWRFEANLRKDDAGRITGGMVLERANERFEFRALRMEAFVEGDEVRRVFVDGRGLKTSGNRSEDFEFTGTVEPSAAGGVLIYDIKDGFVDPPATPDGPPFEAEGRMDLVTATR